MKLVLLTYDSVVAHNAGYAYNSNPVKFAEILLQLASDFEKNTGAKKEDIYWQEVTNSDWCNRMIIIHARVNADWKPTKTTFVIDDTYDPNWYPNLAKDLGSWIYGRGRFVNIQDHPAANPHSLYRTNVK